MDWLNTHEKGLAVEHYVLARFLELGFKCCLPLGSQRFDLLLDRGIGKGWERIQIKKGVLRGGVIRFNSSSYDNIKRKHRSYVGEIDGFAVWLPENRKTYLVPVEDLGSYSGFLRLYPAKNNQSRKVRWAQDHEV